MSLPTVRLGVVPFSADRTLLHPVEMFFMHDDAQVNVELVSGWLRVTAPSEIALYTDELKAISVIKPGTNSEKFANKVYANVLS